MTTLYKKNTIPDVWETAFVALKDAYKAYDVAVATWRDAFTSKASKATFDDAGDAVGRAIVAVQVASAALSSATLGS